MTTKSARRGAAIAAAAMLSTLASAPALAALTVGAGSSLHVGDGALDLGCSDWIIAGSAASGSGSVAGIANLAITGGSLTAGAGRFALGGDFSDAGAFVPGASRVSIVDACGGGTSTVSGATSFYDLVVASATGKQLVLPAALTQSVAHALTLQGAAGHLLGVLSSAAGQQALLNVSTAAAQTIAWVDARDDKASGATIAPGSAASFQSVDGGNLTNWFVTAVIVSGGGAPVPAPALGRPAARRAARRLRMETPQSARGAAMNRAPTIPARSARE
ncbi:MAG: hypothetical protein QM741_00540 [Rudaea sp.]|uniref:hypothetical protein n=1 Tax=Rudaea sp. TaxID=2136325 RepID=UPI0039E39F34